MDEFRSSLEALRAGDLAGWQPLPLDLSAAVLVCPVFPLAVPNGAAAHRRQPDLGGNGLTNMNRRLTDLGGTCEIRSQSGSGTKVILRLKLQNSRKLDSAAAVRPKAKLFR